MEVSFLRRIRVNDSQTGSKGWCAPSNCGNESRVQTLPGRWNRLLEKRLFSFDKEIPQTGEPEDQSKTDESAGGIPMRRISSDGVIQKPVQGEPRKY